MPRATVLAFLGKPIRTFTIENITVLAYSDIGHYTSRWQKAYCQRWIALGCSNTVVHVFKQTITTDHDPLYPVTQWQKDSNGVFQAHVTEEYDRR